MVILLPSPTPTPSLPKPSLRSDIPGPGYCIKNGKAKPGSMALRSVVGPNEADNAFCLLYYFNVRDHSLGPT